MKNKSKTIVIGVTGGIASYKTCEAVRLLIKEGHAVHVVMTEHAQKFVTPLTFQTLTGNPVATDMFKLMQESEIGHIKLADSADVVLVCPATANIIAKAAHGICDDFLSTILLATKAPIIMAPSMNVNMWENPITQDNVNALNKRGVQFVGPDEGVLACGYAGKGRMSEPEKIVLAVNRVVKSSR
ncbi:MAG: hypothetical protein ACD_62C00228G0003 [uncultured bacterium]|nr:MAG: hypothetical protein ACD_62C00228G0003 [uncultured bacterium]HLD43973.1 bifunctional phosphopantothenoylcysteine decarboxylase/phosphopantothenate--cysteine ligase CoaBC [bacterium]